MSAALPNPLHDLHRQAEAEFQSYGPIEIVSTFGEPQAEYAAIRKSCGLMDEPHRSFLELTGPDRLSFLNNLLTNQTYDKQAKTGISAGSVVYAFLLDAKAGRIQLDVHVIELGDGRTIVELDARLVDRFRAALDRYLFSEKVSIADRRETLHQIALHGPRAAEVLDQALDAAPNLADRSGACGVAKLLGHDVVIWRNDVCGVPGFHLIVPTDAARAVWMHLVTRFATAPDPSPLPSPLPSPRVQGEGERRLLRPIGWAVFNTTRIEARQPLFGIDFDEQTLPAETGALLNRAVSFTKGCYPGQEIVARMHARQQVARQIAGFRMAGEELPLAGAQVFDERDQQVGIITSSTISPVLSNAAIGLAMVKRPSFNVGTKLRIGAEGAMRDATVVATPFV